VRTAHEATRIVEEIIASELAEIEFQPAYQAALEAIKSLQKPVLDEFSKKTTETLKSFLPGMRSVKFSISDERRYTALRHAIDIEVDDGAVTSLEAKGDGVQSLVALGLRRHLLEESRERRTYIFAVEEPEAHLHPNAIHELREVLKDLSQVDQLIITTHSGLLANRSPVSSNIIVNRSKAFSAKNLSDIRTALGIRSNDNLLNAELVLLVEGDDDKLALRAVLGQRSPNLEVALESGRLIIDSLDGAGSLGAKIGLYRGILCRVHCFLDNDVSGRNALEKAQKANLIDNTDFNLALIAGKNESEFEDMLNESAYAPQILARFGIDLSVIKPRNRKAKWSSRMADVFAQAGKPFGDVEKQRIKFITADAVASAPSDAIAVHAEGVIISLVASLERKLAND
jgi:predicted ATP-dependent endonuclease of OLD family